MWIFGFLWPPTRPPPPILPTHRHLIAAILYKYTVSELAYRVGCRAGACKKIIKSRSLLLMKLFKMVEIWSQHIQCATFPIDRGPDLGKNWVGLGKLSNLVARRSMVISCVLLDDSITGLQVHTVGLWWIILTLDRWSMTSANTISHSAHTNSIFFFRLSSIKEWILTKNVIDYSGTWVISTDIVKLQVLRHLKNE